MKKMEVETVTEAAKAYLAQTPAYEKECHA